MREFFPQTKKKKRRHIIFVYQRANIRTKKNVLYTAHTANLTRHCQTGGKFFGKKTPAQILDK